MVITNEEFESLIKWSARLSTSYKAMTPKAQKAFNQFYQWLYERDRARVAQLEEDIRLYSFTDLDEGREHTFQVCIAFLSITVQWIEN